MEDEAFVNAETCPKCGFYEISHNVKLRLDEIVDECQCTSCCFTWKRRCVIISGPWRHLKEAGG